MPDRLSEEEVENALIELPEWELQGRDIMRVYEFKNFGESIEFVNTVAALAEAANHHPDIDIRWNKVRVKLSTHSKGGLTQLDFDLAEKLDAALLD
ncbi:MAG: 4a-hydroxytetrahydrobiopterin dehydratase [Chthoniobacterales bacterium]